MPHFFISYAKKDTRQLALDLSEALNALPNVTAWVDKSLRAGRSWAVEIQTQIDKCDYMIVLYSPDINRHKQGEKESYVLTEIAYAKYTAEKLIIPVMAQKTAPPIDLTTVHYIDYTLDGLTLADLVQAICEDAEIDYVPTPPLAPPRVQGGESVEAQFTDDILTQWNETTRKILGDDPLFEWCSIPAGRVQLLPRADSKGYIKEPTQFDVSAFWMAKYPVTVAQYTVFLLAGGYEQEQFWTKAGWQWRGEYKVTRPLYWESSPWNTPDHPVIGVSWYEAWAFSQWLNQKLVELVGAHNTSLRITLPTEAQWQRAAQGDDGREFTWGNQPLSPDLANYGKNLGETTTPVTKYPKNISPYGVGDMIGNVWEWCLTDFETGITEPEGNNLKVLKGGSWYSQYNDTNKSVTISIRNSFWDFDGYLSRGFRVICS